MRVPRTPIGLTFEMRYRSTSAAHGAVVAEGDSIIVTMDHRRGRKDPVPPELRARIEAFELTSRS